jgi:hypothetical protein
LHARVSARVRRCGIGRPSVLRVARIDGRIRGTMPSAARVAR